WQTFSVQRELLRKILLEDERTLTGDSHRNHLVSITINRVQHSARRRGTDGMLAGTPAEEHHHRLLVHYWFSPPAECRRLSSGAVRCHGDSSSHRAPSSPVPRWACRPRIHVPAAESGQQTPGPLPSDSSVSQHPGS